MNEKLRLLRKWRQKIIGMKEGLRGVYVRESQAILARFGIDINDPANLMWASNTKGVHTQKEYWVQSLQQKK